MLWYYVKYLANYLDPIRHTDGIFYRYAEGVWRPIGKHQIAAVAALALKDAYQDRVGDQCPGRPGPGPQPGGEGVGTSEDVMLINVKNGMIDLRTRELIPHSLNYYSRAQIPVPWDKDAFSQRWHDSLLFFFPGDEALNKYFVLQQFFGYALLRDCRYQKALFMYGTGSNGKSTVIDVLRAMVGPENCSALSLTDFARNFNIYSIQNKLVNIATETNTKDPQQTEIFKAVITGDLVKGEKKYGDIYNFKPYAKIFVAMNDMPVVPDHSHGFDRRIVVLNFDRRISAEESKGNYHKEIIEELPAS